MDCPSVNTYSELLALKNHEEDEIILVKETDQYYICKDNQWMLYIPEEKTCPALTLYELNKMIMAKFKTYSEEDILKSKEDIRKYVDNTNGFSYMLLCNDLRYYTVFIKDESYEEAIEDVLIECLNNLGEIKSIDFTNENDAIEIWFYREDELYVSYFFVYGGIEKCH